MSEHSVFAFSASPRWIPCPGSMAYPENTEEGGDAGVYADEGTAAHALAASVLRTKGAVSANDFIGTKITVGKREFEVTEEFASYVQDYVDDVQRRAMGGYLLVEQKVGLDGVEGFTEANYGTSDAIIAIHNYGVVEDLKFGQGEKVYAWLPARPDSPFTMTTYDEYDQEIEVEPNFQLMLYALAGLKEIRILGDEPHHITIVINQPRLGSVSELNVPIAVLERFALFAAEALKKAEYAKAIGVERAEKAFLMNPGEKQCRWCRALARCPAAAKKVQTEMAEEFDVIVENAAPPIPPIDTPRLAKAMLAVPFISDWCRAVMAKANELVAGGTEIIGPDKKPYKFVEGKQGDRKWADEAAAEGALTGVLGTRAYQPQKILTASGASKILDKAKTKAIWNDLFVPLIKRAPGKPMLVMGSDPRPAFSPASDSDEFEEIGADE